MVWHLYMWLSKLCDMEVSKLLAACWRIMQRLMWRARVDGHLWWWHVAGAIRWCLGLPWSKTITVMRFKHRESQTLLFKVKGGCQQAMKQSFTTRNDGHFDQPGTDVKSVWGIILGPFDSSETRSDWMSRAWFFCPLFFCLPYCLWWEVEKEMEGGPVVMLGWFLFEQLKKNLVA